MYSVEAFLTDAEEISIISAIENAERASSGEIRVHIENSTEKPTLERAKEVFLYLKMDLTKLHNAVLFYVAVDSKQFAIIGDTGIDERVPDNFWEDAKDIVLKYFSKNQVAKGLEEGILKVGEQLQEFFPYQIDDQDELPNTISVGQ